MNPTEPTNEPTMIPGLRRVPRTGVIYVMHRAQELGYQQDGKDWYNLGQGSPESGPLDGAPPRVEALTFAPSLNAYAPVDGVIALRERVADYYNQLFRRGKRSQYTADNVSIAPGGRAAMARVVASMAPMNLGHFIPDYTAYEELLFTFRGFIPIPILLEADLHYFPSGEQLRHEIVGRGLSAVLCSNPCNPTGQVVCGQTLGDWVDVARS